ncbi:unnamed protein product [marine sediment metagenome]|uniref:Uncharacterized protein n=1 Tax=marine sediment metagenome TaxID=412755 RepID=X1UNP1_9ZZZZ
MGEIFLEININKKTDKTVLFFILQGLVNYIGTWFIEQVSGLNLPDCSFQPAFVELGD